MSEWSPPNEMLPFRSGKPRSWSLFYVQGKLRICLKVHFFHSISHPSASVCWGGGTSFGGRNLLWRKETLMGWGRGSRGRRVGKQLFAGGFGFWDHQPRLHLGCEGEAGRGFLVQRPGFCRCEWKTSQPWVAGPEKPDTQAQGAAPLMLIDAGCGGLRPCCPPHPGIYSCCPQRAPSLLWLHFAPSREERCLLLRCGVNGAGGSA